MGKWNSFPKTKLGLLGGGCPIHDKKLKKRSFGKIHKKQPASDCNYIRYFIQGIKILTVNQVGGYFQSGQ